MNLKEKMAEIAAKASAYTVRIDAGESLSETEMGDLKGLLAEARNCSAQLKAAEDARGLFDSLSAKKSDVVPTGTKAALNSLGHEFVRNMKEKGRSLLEEGTFTAPEFKAAPDVQTVGAHDGAFGPLFVRPRRRRFHEADLAAEMRPGRFADAVIGRDAARRGRGVAGAWPIRDDQAQSLSVAKPTALR